MLIFDIETAPVSDDILAAMLPPFEDPPHPGEFDPSSVKYGNLKDEAKKAAKLEEARAAHESAVNGHAATVEEMKSTHWQNFKNSAALSPVTGQILAIGCWSMTKNSFSLVAGDEPSILAKFWEIYGKMRGSTPPRKLVGCNSNGFDLPFLIRRSWILGVEIPATVRKGRYFDELFVDIRDIWLCGQHWGGCESSLNHMAVALGVGKKTEGVTGADFGRLWNGTKEEREQAIEYLKNDVEITAKVAVRLGVV